MPGQHDGQHQQRGRDRPQDEGARRAHRGERPGARSARFAGRARAASSSPTLGAGGARRAIAERAGCPRRAGVGLAGLAALRPPDAPRPPPPRREARSPRRPAALRPRGRPIAGSVTRAPSFRRSAPSVITRSPTCRPVATCDLVDGRLPRVTGRSCTVRSSFSTYTKSPVAAVAQRGHRHDHRAVDRAQQQLHVDELAREQRWRRRCRSAPWRAPCRSGCRPGCRATRRRRSSSIVACACGRTRSTGKQRALGDARLQLGHAVLRHGELDVDRRELRDHRDAGRVAGADQVAGVDRAQADAAGDRRDDPACSRGSGAPCLRPRGRSSRSPSSCLTSAAWVSTSWRAIESCCSSVGSAAASRARSRAAPRRAGAAPMACCSAISNGRGSMRASSCPFLHHLAFVEQDLREHARDLRPHRHRGRGRHGAQRVEDDRDVERSRGRDADGAGRPAAAAAGPPGRHRRAARTGRRRRGFAMRQVPGESAQREQGDDGDQAAEPAPTRPLRRRRGGGGGALFFGFSGHGGVVCAVAARPQIDAQCHVAPFAELSGEASFAPSRGQFRGQTRCRLRAGV